MYLHFHSKASIYLALSLTESEEYRGSEVDIPMALGNTLRLPIKRQPLVNR